MDFGQNFKIFYTFCNLFVFSFYRMGFLVKVSDLLEKLHQICCFSGCDLHLPDAPGLRKPLAILQCHKESSEIYVFWKVFVDFLKSLWFFVAFHCTDWLSSPKEVIFMKKIHQICWFSGYNFHLPVKKSAEIYAFRKKSGDFLKNLHLFCVPKLL